MWRAEAILSRMCSFWIVSFLTGGSNDEVMPNLGLRPTLADDEFVASLLEFTSYSDPGHH